MLTWMKPILKIFSQIILLMFPQKIRSSFYLIYMAAALTI